MRHRRTLPTRYRQGYLIGTKELDKENRQIIVRPRFVADNDHANNWILVDDPELLRGLYQPRGVVGVPAHLGDELPGGLLRVAAQQRPYRKSESDFADHWEIKATWPLRQIIDLRPFAETADGMRQLMSGSGIELETTPLERVLLQVKEQLYVGPFTLQLATKSGQRYCLSNSDLANLIPVWKGDARSVDIFWEGTKRLVEGPATYLSEFEYWDWRPDDAFLSDVIGKLKIAQNSDADSALLQAAESAILGAANKGLSSAQRKRLEDMIDQRQLTAQQLRGIVGKIRGSAIGADIVAELLQEEIQSKRQRIQQELEVEIAGRREQLEREMALQHELVATAKRDRERVLQDLDDSLDRRRRELESLEHRTSEIESALDTATSRMIDLTNSAAQVLQDEKTFARLQRDIETSILDQIAGLIAAAPLIGQSRTIDQNDAKQLVSQSPFVPKTESIIEFDSLNSLANSLAGSLGGHGLTDSILSGLLAAFANQLVPLIGGSRGLDVLEALAGQISHGQLLIVPVHPATLTATDLIGNCDSRSGRFSPTATGLADLLVHAKSFNYPIIIVLEGINRVPIESAFLPLLEAYNAPARRLIRTSPRAVIDPSDPYASIAEFSWPRNLWLAATLIEGPSAFALPKAWWSYGTFIELDGGQRNRIDRAGSSQAIAFKDWQRLADQLTNGPLRSFSDTMDSDSEFFTTVPIVLQAATRGFGRATEAISTEDFVPILLQQLLLPGLVHLRLFETAESIDDEYFEKNAMLDRLKAVLAG